MNIIHDYLVSKYVIDLNNRCIRIDIYKYSTKKTILFKSVFLHNFCNDMPYSSIFDSEEKNYAWPIMSDDLKELENEIKENRSRHFNLNSSYGLNGWILAETAEVIDRRSYSE